jgi:hypothetical protein
MTTQQLRHFHAALIGLFDQATGKLSPFASNVLLSPCYFGLGAVPLPPVTNTDDHLWWPPRPQQPGQALHPISSGQPGTIQSP